ncbi:AAA family ATPase [Patescibacteria group bacterium]
MKKVLITGIAGVGKSTVCNELRKMGYSAYDLDDVEGLCRMVDNDSGETLGRFDLNSLSMSKDCKWVCDAELLNEIMSSDSNEVSFYCGIVSNMDEIFDFFDSVILLKTDNKTLSKRLQSRSSKKSSFGPTPEIQEWILSIKDGVDSDLTEKGAISMDANKEITSLANEIIEKIK